MKNKYIIFSIVVLVLFVTLSVSFDKFKTTNTYIEDSSSNQIKVTKGISMNLEQTAGAGDYKTVTRSKWPTEGYKFNSELSRCENGSKISWDDTNNTVVVSGNLSDKCYVYFDIYVPTIADYCSSGTELASCIKHFGNLGPSVSAIYIHNSSLTNGAGDNSYIYAVASDQVNNFVCFGFFTKKSCPEDNLYRIIGVFGDNVRLIKYDYANSNLLGTNGDYKGSSTPDSSSYKGSLTSIDAYYWNYKNNTSINNGWGSNEWSTSLLNKINLNTNYLINIGTTWSNLIEDAEWKVSGHTTSGVTPSEMYTAEITNATKTYGNIDGTSKIGLMYASDYGFAASPSAWTKTLYSYDGNDVNGTSIKTINWMYMGNDDLTITTYSSTSYGVFYLSYDGILEYGDAHYECGSRPVFYLKSSVLYAGGSGTKDSPIILVV